MSLRFPECGARSAQIDQHGVVRQIASIYDFGGARQTSNERPRSFNFWKF